MRLLAPPPEDTAARICFSALSLTIIPPQVVTYVGFSLFIKVIAVCELTHTTV